MKAIVGVNEVRKWTGQTMGQAMIAGVAKEHEALGQMHKCGQGFGDFKCARPAWHDGFHFSTRLVINALPITTVIDAVWENSND